MTCKQIRNNQLEELKQADNISTATYRVEVLNGAFLPAHVWDFETMEAAEQKYQLLRAARYPGFLRKYAMISF